MPWELLNDRPIYSQIVEKIKLRIVSGYYPAGEKLPTVRELAAQAGVNPNTMQKAFAELERSGLILTQRTSGRTVTQDEGLILEARRSIANAQIKAFLEKMQELGFDSRASLELTKKLVEEDGK